MGALKQYMTENKITGYRIAKENAVSQPTIDRAANGELNNLSFRVIRELANSLGKSVGEVANELDNIDRTLW